MKDILNPLEIIKGILIIVLYFLLQNILTIPFIFFINKGLIKNNNQILSLSYIIIYLISAIVFTLIYRKEIIKNFKDFIKEHHILLPKALNYWLKGLFIMYVSSIVITALGFSQTINQAENIELIKKIPLAQFICACILGPYLEELVFRRGLKKSTTNIHVYAITTGIIFGFCHIITSLTNKWMLLYIIPYSSLGIAFGYLYKKTDNIFSSIIVHMIHNSVAMGLILVTL